MKKILFQNNRSPNSNYQINTYTQILIPKQRGKFTKLLIGICLLFGYVCLVIGIYSSFAFAQDTGIDFTLDVNSRTIALPKIFSVGIDLSGRGLHCDLSWPQNLASSSSLAQWRQDIGFKGMYRLQWNLWQISQLSKNKQLQDKLLAYYEDIIRDISYAGGIVILDIFSTPAGLGEVLDKRSPPWDIFAFKALIKQTMRYLSCQKRYSVWYEVWSGPDLDDFFLGQKKDYFSLYQAVASAAKELKLETGVDIPVGGPAVSWWFQSLGGNTIFTPERSLIYELIKFCRHRNLPLDFISWHAYQSDPLVEKETTIYGKTAISLIREWLSYFNFNPRLPLIIDEWNFDSGANTCIYRSEQASVAASFIPARLKNMYEAGLDYQLFFSLEDFRNNKEGVSRNTGIFAVEDAGCKGAGRPKCIYNVMRMLNRLGKELYLSSRLDDEFIGILATRTKDNLSLLIFYYIDPYIARNYLSRNLTRLNTRERKQLISIIKSKDWQMLLEKKVSVMRFRLGRRLKKLLNEAIILNQKAHSLRQQPRNINLCLKHLKGGYVYRRYSVNKDCASCPFEPMEEKEFSQNVYQESLSIEPYSVILITLEKTIEETGEQKTEKPKGQKTEKLKDSKPVNQQTGKPVTDN
jgi:hypothetical protein